MYSTQPQSLDKLQNRILQEATLIDRLMFRNAVTHFYNRIAFCQETQGFQFEHLHWSVRGKGTHGNQAPRNVRCKGTHANQAHRNVRGKGTHANQATQREQNLLHPRRFSSVILNVNVNCLEKTEKPWRSSPRSIQSSPMNFALKFTSGITLTSLKTLLISNNL